MELERQNPQWEGGFFHPYEKKRFLFENLEHSLGSGMITAVHGLRRVGKSVLLKQLLNNCIQKGTSRKSTFYFSFDEQAADFWETIREYERISGEKLGRKNFIFLDEVQKVPDWKAKVKLLYDTSGARIALCGSNSSKIRKGSESLAGRINEFHLPQLSFAEFLHLRGKEENPQLQHAAELEFNEFLQKPFPQTALNPSLDPKEYAASIAKKIIFEDLPSVFPIDEPQLLHSLFSLICKNPGCMLEYSTVASDLGRDRKTVSLYLDYLGFGFLVRKLFNFSRNSFTSEKKLKKFYPSLAVFCECSEPLFIEASIAQVLDAKFFWREKDRHEVDFVNASPLAAFEVKYSGNVAAADWSGLHKFSQHFPEATVHLVSKKEQEHTVPYYKFESHIKKLGIGQ